MRQQNQTRQRTKPKRPNWQNEPRYGLRSDRLGPFEIGCSRETSYFNRFAARERCTKCPKGGRPGRAARAEGSQVGKTNPTSLC